MSANAGAKKGAASSAMTGWIPPAVVYIVFLGALGVTTKLALRHVGWQDVIVWTTVMYVLLSTVLLVLGQAQLRFGAGALAAIASGVLASTALVAFFIALGRGDASLVVPVTSVYPVVTLILSAIVLAEGISPLKVVGTLAVVVGVALISVGG